MSAICRECESNDSQRDPLRATMIEGNATQHGEILLPEHSDMAVDLDARRFIVTVHSQVFGTEKQDEKPWAKGPFEEVRPGDK